MTIIPILKKWRRENQEFKVILSYTVQGQPGLHEPLSQKQINKEIKEKPIVSSSVEKAGGRQYVYVLSSQGCCGNSDLTRGRTICPQGSAVSGACGSNRPRRLQVTFHLEGRYHVSPLLCEQQGAQHKPSQVCALLCPSFSLLPFLTWNFLHGGSKVISRR